MSAVPRRQDYCGPAILSYAFRPFFFFGALYAGAIILVWLPMFYGDVTLASTLAPRDWHIHEMLFGYIAAVITGFLFTAIPNWTGRLPFQGVPLMLLLLTWIGGRIAVSASALIGWLPAAIIDCAFLVLVAAAAAREIIAGRNWSNLKIVTVVSLLAACNIAFHLEAHVAGIAVVATRFGIAAVIVLITLIGGRIIPSFTRNWLAQHNPGRLPVPFGRFDLAVVAAGAAALLLWVTRPEGAITGAALLACGALHLIRLARWAGDRTVSDRLVLILHVAYAFVPAGFVLTGLSAFGVLTESAGIHAWTGGAIGTMTLAVMSRATLGHTGRKLKASPGTHAVYAAVVIAALARIAAAFAPEQSTALLGLAATFWAAAFIGFAATYATAFWMPRRSASAP